MGFAFKVNEAKDDGGRTYFWGYMKMGMCSIKVNIYKSRKEDEPEKWNVFMRQVEDAEKTTTGV